MTISSRPLRGCEAGWPTAQPPSSSASAAKLAEQKRREWEILTERSALGEAQIIAPLFKDAVIEFSHHGMSHRAWKTRSVREYQLGVMERE